MQCRGVPEDLRQCGRKYILRQLSDYEFWYAEYEAKPRIVFNFDMWQYSSTGSVNGIEGDVDLNIYFRES